MSEQSPAGKAAEHLEAFRESLNELRNMQRAQAMALRRVLLAWIHEIENEWNVTPTTRECRERLG